MVLLYRSNLGNSNVMFAGFASTPENAGIILGARICPVFLWGAGILRHNGNGRKSQCK